MKEFIWKVRRRYARAEILEGMFGPFPPSLL
jgi:hypothetical protein